METSKRPLKDETMTPPRKLSSGEKLRLTCLELAIKCGDGPMNFVKTAGEFEKYLLDGSQPKQ